MTFVRFLIYETHSGWGVYKLIEDLPHQRDYMFPVHHDTLMALCSTPEEAWEAARRIAADTRGSIAWMNKVTFNSPTIPMKLTP